MVVPFCGEDWVEVFVTANGIVSFGSPLGYSNESVATFTQESSPPAVTAWWDDLDQTGGGIVAWVEHPDAVAVHWRGIGEFDSGGSSSFEVVLRADGRTSLHHQGMTSLDGLLGWSCGTGLSPPEVDFTALAEGGEGEESGLTNGSPDGMYELFTGSVGDFNDVGGRGFLLLGAGG